MIIITGFPDSSSQTSDSLRGLLEDINMGSYKIDTRDKVAPITLNDGEGQLKGPSGGTGTFNLKEKTKLSHTFLFFPTICNRVKLNGFD